MTTAHTEAIALIIGAVIALGAGSFIRGEVDQIKYDKLVAADAKALSVAKDEAAKQQKTLDDKALAAASNDAEAQVKIVTRTVTLTKEIPVYVKDHPTDCITYGFVRLLDSAVLKVDPSTLTLPAGVTDETCTALKPTDLAQSIVSNYSTAEQNAQQLNDLIGLVQQK